MEKTAFITGATGFVGGALAERLVGEGWQLVALVREGSDCSRLKALGVTLVIGDLSEPETYRLSLDGCSLVFHCAAVTGVGHSIETFHKVIKAGTQTLLDAAISANVKKFIYISSIMVYEFNAADGVYLEDAPGISSSIDAYGNAKLQAESDCLNAHERGDISVCVVRPAFIYGPGDRPGGFLPEMVGMLQKNKFRLMGDGGNRIPLISALDLADLLVLCADSDNSAGQTYNACSEYEVTWRQFVDRICETLGLNKPGSVSPKVVFAIASFMELLAKPGLIKKLPLSKSAVLLLSKDTHFPIDKARQQLGFVPRVEFKQGIAAALSDIS